MIDQLVDDRFEALSPDERAALSSDDIKSMLHARVGSTGNVRKLGKLVDEVLSLKLVRSMLSDAPHSSNATKTKDAA